MVIGYDVGSRLGEVMGLGDCFGFGFVVHRVPVRKYFGCCYQESMVGPTVEHHLLSFSWTLRATLKARLSGILTSALPPNRSTPLRQRI